MDLNNLLTEDTPQGPQEDMLMIIVTGNVVPVPTIDCPPRQQKAILLGLLASILKLAKVLSGCSMTGPTESGMQLKAFVYG